MFYRYLLLTLLLWPLVHGQNGPLTKDQIIQMSNAGVSEDVIVGKINSEQNLPQFNAADFITMKLAGVSDGVIRALATLPYHPAVGSGLEYHLTTGELDLVYAIINVGEESDGYWRETRISSHSKSATSDVVMKELMVGQPPLPQRRILKVNGLKSMEVRVAGAKPEAKPKGKPNYGMYLFVLNAFVGALDVMSADAAQRQVRAAANSRPVRTDAERLQYAGQASTRITPPPISPPSSDTVAPTKSTNPPTVTGPAGKSGSGGLSTNLAKVGTESVTVPAGTFECEHYAGDASGKHSEVWISSQAPWYGLVKLVSPDGNLELQKVFKQETSQITDPPINKN